MKKISLCLVTVVAGSTLLGASPYYELSPSANATPEFASTSENFSPKIAEIGTELLQTATVAQALNQSEAPIPSAEIIGPRLADQMIVDWDAVGLVQDVQTGQTLFEHDVDEPLVPASSLKILNALAVLDTLDPQSRFTTTVVADDDALTLVGGGDSMLAEGASRNNGAMGQVGLKTLAEETLDELLAHPVGIDFSEDIDVHVDTSMYEDTGYSDAWSEEIAESDNIAPVTPLALYGGREEDTEHGEGKRVDNTTKYAGEAFADALNDAAEDLNIEGTFEYQGTEEVSDAASEVVSAESATVAEQVAFMLDVSDNQVAETLARNAAIDKGLGSDYEASAQLLYDTAEKYGFADDTLEIADTCGLSDKNQITPEELVQALMVAGLDERFEPLLEALPTSGESGTMRNRLTNAPYKGRVHAKTGTLHESTTLTGFTTTEDGRELYFMFGAVNIEEGEIFGTRLHEDQLVSTVVDCGC